MSYGRGDPAAVLQLAGLPGDQSGEGELCFSDSGPRFRPAGYLRRLASDGDELSVLDQRPMFVLRNTLTGMGSRGYCVFSSICELIGKTVGGLLAVKWFGFWGICIAMPLTGFLAMVYCGILVRHFLK